MSNYLIAYHGGNMSEKPEEAARHREKFMAWIKGWGEDVVNPGTPLGTSNIVTSEGIEDNEGPDRLTGFSIVKAENREKALEMAKSCPFLEMGTIEVAEVMEM